MSKSLAKNSRIIPKIIHDKEGRAALAFFAVIEEANGYSVKLVGVRYESEAEAVIALPAATKKPPVVSTRSPYFESSEKILSDFSFLTKQSARAPDCA